VGRVGYWNELAVNRSVTLISHSHTFGTCIVYDYYELNNLYVLSLFHNSCNNSVLHIYDAYTIHLASAVLYHDCNSLTGMEAEPETKKNAVASQPTGRQTAGAGVAASSRQNISAYALITCATKEYKPDILIPHIEKNLPFRLCKQIFLHDLF